MNKILKAKYGADIFTPDVSKVLYTKSVMNLNSNDRIPVESDILEFLFLSYFLDLCRESPQKGFIRVPIQTLTGTAKTMILEKFPIFQVKTLDEIEYLSVPVKVFTWNKWAKEGLNNEMD